jgi:hypothetical protein
MRLSILLLLPLCLAGCISYSNTGTPPAQNTLVVPPGSIVYCSNGGAPPCR